MKDKHVYITADHELQQKVYAEVAKKLVVNKSATAKKLIVKFIFYFLLVTAAYTAIYIPANIVLLFCAYISFGLLLVLLGFNFAHDFCHHTVFKNKPLDNFGFTAIYTLLGAHAEAWQFRHVHSHHHAPNVKEYDTDLQITHLIRVEPGIRYRWYHRFQHWYAPLAYTTYSVYWVFVKDFVVYFSGNVFYEKKSWKNHFSFWLQKAIYISYLLVFPIMFSPFAWYWTAGAFLAMHLVQSLFLLFTFFMTHHVENTAYFDADGEGNITTSWFTNQVKSSNDFYPFSHTANFIFGGFNNHIAHHLFPHIHHVHYPQLNRILYRVLQEHAVKPNVTSFTGGIRSHLRHLKNMGSRP